MSSGQPALRALPVAHAPGGRSDPAEEVRLRRAPFLLAAFGLAMFVLGTTLPIAWPGALATRGEYGSWHALALTHVFALGFATSLVMAVLYQFIPANFHANVRGVRRTRLTILGYTSAVCAFSWSLGSGTPAAAAVAGPLLAVSVAIFLSQMASVVVRAKRRTREGLFHIAAFVALAGVIVAGSLLATSLGSGWLGDPGRLLSAKVVLAVAGWLGMIVAGVSYHTVRGLNASAARPAWVLSAFCAAAAGVTLAVALLLAGAGAPWRVAAAALLVAAAVLHAADVVRLVRSRAASAAGVTWRGQLAAVTVLFACSVEAVIAMAAEAVWGAMAVSGLLGGVVPLAIVANGNRVIPVLIGNRYDGRGRAPLSSAPLGGAAMTSALAAAGLSWVLLQLGILGGQATVIRLAALLLFLAAVIVAGTVARQALGARSAAATPSWTVSP